MKIKKTNRLLFFLYLIIVQLAVADDSSCVAQVSLYLSELKSIKANFVQNNSDGSVSSGAMYVKSPQYFKLKYYTPRVIIINASNSFVTYYDKQLGQATSIPSSNIYKRIFGRDNYIDKIRCEDGRAYLTIHDEKFGEVILRFKLTPVEISGLEFVDNGFMGVKAYLFDVQYNVHVSSMVFNQFD